MKAPCAKASKVRSAGFTLVELMVTLIIIAILLAIGVPSSRALIQSQRLTTTVNDFFSAINLTRAEAIKRNGSVDLAPLDGRNWSKGWAVFVDSDGDHVPDAARGDTIIFQSEAVPMGMNLASNLTDGGTYITYTATGRTRTTASPNNPQLGTITFAMGDTTCTAGTECRRIKINLLGRARVCNPAVDSTSCQATASD